MRIGLRFAGLVLLGALAAISGCAHADRSAAPLTPAEQAANLASFDEVWTTIRDQHWDPTLHGVDWEAARTELRPQVERAKSTAAARAVMQRLIARLNQSHFAIIPASSYAASELRPVGGSTASAPVSAPRAGPGSGAVGIDPRPLGMTIVVWRVAPDSQADLAGVRPGWTLERIADESVSQLLQHTYAVYDNPREREIAQISTLQRSLHGPVGSHIRCLFRDEHEARRTLNLEVDNPRGTLTEFGNLPPLPVEFESARLDGGIGYIRFSMFLDPARIMPKFEAAVREYLDAPGLVLDLRGNLGGLGAMSTGIAGWFVNEPGHALGSMITRAGESKFNINSRATTYDGPLAILVDAMSMSTTEILAAGLHDLGRARTFGSPTAGAALPSTIEILPNGDRFQYAFANYVSIGGKPLEGVGVPLDERVVLDRESLLRGHDPVIERACAWIRATAAQPPEESPH